MTNFRSPGYIEEQILEPGVIERSAIKPVLDYWQDLRGHRIAPRWQEFEFMKLPPPLISCLEIYDILHDPLDLKVRFFGTGITKYLGLDFSGKRLSECEHHGYLNKLVDALPDILENKQHSLHLLTYVSVKGITYQTETVRMPFSDDGINVDKVMTAVEPGTLKDFLEMSSAAD